MERDDLICKCGHSYNWHLHFTEGPFGACLTGKRYHCDKFIPDNLKYLEMLSEEKEVADL